MKLSKMITPALVWLVMATPLVAQTDYEKVAELNEELIAFARPVVVDGVPDLSAATVRAREDALGEFRSRLVAIDAESWPVSRKIDYLLVLARINALEFDQRVMKPHARDPLMYLYQVSNTPYTEVPVAADEMGDFKLALSTVPKKMDQAKANLTAAVGDLAKLALFHLDNFDGVGQRQPYRDSPPEGTIGWYRDLCTRLEQHHSELVDDCTKATAAVVGYRDWLNDNIGSMPVSAAIGIENYDWYLKHVRLLPYTVQEVMTLGKRELHRYRFDYFVERNKNEDLAQLTLTTTAEQHERRTREAEEQIRGLVAEQGLMTIPDETPPTFETDTFWSPRATTTRHFWEEIQFRNALNNHIHASIPGHRWDGFMRRYIDNPVRKTYRDSGRGEGWGTYLEEMLLKAGIADETPRARELFYVALIKRGSRVYAEVRMHGGQLTLDEANEYMIDYVPFMEENLGRYDLAGYLRRPGLGSAYIMGKIQIEQLVSERAHQLGDAFDLGKFHDEFLSVGPIPVALIRWEMTGYDDEALPLWNDVVAAAKSANRSE